MKDAAREMETRLRAMLTKDSAELRNGFLQALNGDLTKLLSDYFELNGRANVEVTRTDDGNFRVSFNVSAAKIKNFSSTMKEI